MQKKLTVLFAFAIFVLVVGWAITPVLANHKDGHTKGGGGGGGGDDDPFFVDLEGGMVTTELPVTVSQDSSKRIRFVNSDFDLPDAGILLQFDIDFINSKCYVAHGTVVSTAEKSALELELANTNITSGFFIVEVDRKNLTGELVIEYTSEDLESSTRIQYDDHIVPITVIEYPPDPQDGGSITFHFSGTIWIVQLNESGNTDDKVVACPDQTVDVILHQ